MIKNIKQIVLSLFLVLCLQQSYAFTHWELMNLYSADISAITIDPHDENIIYVGAEGARLFKSIDGGRTWRRLSAETFDQHIEEIIIPKDHSATMYIKDVNHLHKSNDSGKTWYNLPIPSGTYFGKLVLNSNNANEMFGLSGYTGDLYQSSDGGYQWLLIKSGPVLPKGEYTNSDIEINPHDGNDMLYLSCEVSQCTISRTIDHALTWQSLLTLSDEWMRSAGYAADNPNILYLLTDKALHRSMDGGKSWLVIKSAESDFLREFTSHSKYPEINYLVTENKITNQYSLWRSKDRGTTWTLQQANIPFQGYYSNFITSSNQEINKLYAGMNDGFAMSNDAGKSWAVNYMGLTPAHALNVYTGSGSPLLFAATSSEMLWRSFDAKQWTHIPLPFSAKIEDIAIQPMSSTNVILSLEPKNNGDYALYYSHDSGETWQKSIITGRAPDDSGVATISAITYDPHNPKHVIASAEYDNYVVISNDGGMHWRAVKFGNYNNYNDHVKFSLNPNKPQEIYLASGFFHRQLYKSYHFGESWSLFPQASDAPQFWNLIVDPKKPSVLYGVTVFKDFPIYKSIDGGFTWLPSSKSLPDAFQGSLLIDPSDPNKLYFASDDYNNVFISSDGAESWVEDEGDLPRSKGIASLAWYQHQLIVSTLTEGLFIRRE